MNVKSQNDRDRKKVPAFPVVDPFGILEELSGGRLYDPFRVITHDDALDILDRTVSKKFGDGTPSPLPPSPDTSDESSPSDFFDSKIDTYAYHLEQAYLNAPCPGCTKIVESALVGMEIYKRMEEEGVTADEVRASGIDDIRDKVRAHLAELEKRNNQNSAPDEKEEIATDLHNIMFDDIGSSGGFSHNTEYTIGVGRIAEGFHCIFGAAMKEIITGLPENSHISEEIKKIEDDVDEYQRDIPQYTVDNSNEIIENAKRVISLTKKIDKGLVRLKNAAVDEDTLVMAKLSNEGLRALCREIIDNPDDKPFEAVRPYVVKLRRALEERIK